MKLHLPSKQIITPATHPLAPGNRDFSRRGFLGAGMTLAAAGVFAAKAGDRSRTDPGPDNPGLDAQNPDSMWPPSTDSKSLVQTFKYPFSLANKLVTGSDGPRTPYLKIHGRREYETHGRRGA